MGIATHSLLKRSRQAQREQLSISRTTRGVRVYKTTIFLSDMGAALRVNGTLFGPAIKVFLEEVKRQVSTQVKERSMQPSSKQLIASFTKEGKKIVIPRLTTIFSSPTCSSS